MGEKRWIYREADPDKIRVLAEEAQVSPFLARLLLNRGVATPAGVQRFLCPDQARWEDPFLLPDMPGAVELILDTIKARRPILVYGDYDVDGLSSTSPLVLFLRRLGAQVDYYIPHRLDEGYGLNLEAVKEAAARGTSLIVTVDCGITGAQEVQAARELGMRVVITDHHAVPPELPPADAVVNPQRNDGVYPGRELCGAGLAFKLIQALSGASGLPPEEAEEYLDLTVLGTIADVVPLIEENRLIVTKGLRRLQETRRPGLRALLQVAGLEGKPLDEGRIAFGLAPRLNAVGRIAEASTGARLLMTDDPAEAAELAAKLDRANKERQAIEAGIVEEAKALVRETVDLETQKVLVLAKEGWHQGVVGIVASRLMGLYYRPVCLLSIHEGMAHGSGRSIPGFHLFQALSQCQEHLVRFGGHAAAAGLTLRQECIEPFSRKINQLADALLSPEDFIPTLELDAVLKIDEINLSLAEEIRRLAPFGAGNPSPVFAAQAVGLRNPRAVGNSANHLKADLYDPKGTRSCDAVGWQMGSCLESLQGHFDTVDVAFELEVNEWNGQRIPQAVLCDLHLAGAETSVIDELFRDAETISDKYADIVEADEFHTKVVGVTFEGRQDLINGLKPGAPLLLKREPGNQHDPWAIRVETGKGQVLGYLKADLSRYLAPAMDKGMSYDAQVASLTGGGQGKSRGVNIFLQRQVSEEELIAHAEARLRRENLGGLNPQSLEESVRRALLGENPFRPKQAEALENLRAGRSTLLIMGTGRGKSAVFQYTGALKALRDGKLTIILYPLRALVNDQFQGMRRVLGPLGLRVFRATGSLGVREREDLQLALEMGEVDFLLTTPEFLQCNLLRQTGVKERLGFLVVDESHHLSREGASRSGYRKLGDVWGELGRPLTLAVTATAGDQVARGIVETLGIDRVVVDPHVRDNLRVVDRRGMSEKMKQAYLEQVLSSGEKTVVYVNSRDQAVDLARKLRQGHLDRKDEIAFYHGGLGQKQRNMVEDLFREGRLRLVVSTSAFGEGVNIPDIRHVLHYHLSFSQTDFNQQSGRAGRDGEEAWVHLLYNRKDAEINRFILQVKAPDRDMLKDIYRALKEAAGDEGVISLGNEELAVAANRAGGREAAAAADGDGAPPRGKGRGIEISAESVSAALGIFEELGLLARIKTEEGRLIRMLPAPPQKLDLSGSVRYNEGMLEKEEFEAFQQQAFSLPGTELLALLNRPIYPKGEETK